MPTILKTKSFKGKKPPSRIRCLCLCECGRKFFAWKQALATGNTKSCGCLRNTHTKTKSFLYAEPYSTRKHPLNTLYTRWASMVERCTSQTSSSWGNYGGRGITVCERWLRFDNFLADMGTPPLGMSLDRIDNSRGYSPDNCQWATAKQQRDNQRPRKEGKTARIKREKEAQRAEVVARIFD